MAEPLQEYDEEDKQLGHPDPHGAQGESSTTPTNPERFESTNQGGVYDKNDAQPITRPDLRAMEGGGQTTPKKTGHLKSVKSGDEQPSAGAGLQQAERAAGAGTAAANTSDQVGKGYTGNNTPVGRLNRLRQRFKDLSPETKKRGLFGGGIVGGVVAVVALLFVAIIPLKIEHVLDDIENHFMGGSNSAVGDLIDNLTGGFLKDEALASKACGGFITNTCSGAKTLYNDSNPVSQLFHTWHENNVGQKLADDFGIEIKYDPTGNGGAGVWYMKAPGITDPETQGVISEANMENPAEDITSDFKEVDRNQIRNTIHEATQNLTLWNRVMVRFKFGRFLEERFHIRRCLMFCGATDALGDVQNKVISQANAAQIYLIDRVITPRSRVLGVVMKCILAAQCNPNQTTPKEECEAGVNCETNGEPVSEPEVEVDSALDSLAAEDATETGEEAIANYNGLEEIGGSAEADIAGAAEGVAADTATTIESQAVGPAQDAVIEGEAEADVPIAGWLIIAFQIANFESHLLTASKGIANKISKLAYMTDAVAAVSLYMEYRTEADTVKTGNTNLTELGSFDTALGPGDHGDQLCNLPVSQGGISCAPDVEVGGTATAEASPLYATLITGNTTPQANTASLLNDISPTAYAATTTDTSNYPTSGPENDRCDDGTTKPYPGTTNTVDPAISGTPVSQSAADNGQLCPEEQLGCAAGPACAFVKLVQTFATSAVGKFIVQLAQLWNDSLGKLVGWISNVVGDIVQFATSWFFKLLDAGCADTIKIGFDHFGIKVSIDIPGFTKLFVPNGGGYTYCAAQSAIKAEIPKILAYLAHWLIPEPFGSNMSGARTFDMVSAGADVSSNNYAQNGLGGEMLTPTQSAAIVNQQNNLAMDAFKKQPLFARLFSTTSDYSLVSDLSVMLPTSASGSLTSVASAIADPFTALAHSFSSLFSLNKASAQTTPQPDPFNVVQYGYPNNTVPADPEAFWNTYCSDVTSTDTGATTFGYNTTASNTLDQNGYPLNSPSNPVPGLPQTNTGSQTYNDPVTTTTQSIPNQDYEGTDPCLLIQAAVGSAGGLFDENMLTPDDLADSTTAGSAPVNGHVFLLGDQLMAGMDSSGLQLALNNRGWNVAQIDDSNPGLTVENAPAEIQADSAALSGADAAGVVIIELGSNDLSDSTTAFSSAIDATIQAIRVLDPTAQIYWVNTYADSAPGNTTYQAINDVITTQSTQDNYNVIDWAQNASNASDAYTYTGPSGIYPSDYVPMVNLIGEDIGAAPTTNVSNVVSNALLTDQPSTPSFFADVFHIFDKVIGSMVHSLSQLDVLWRPLIRVRI